MYFNCLSTFNRALSSHLPQEIGQTAAYFGLAAQSRFNSDKSTGNRPGMAIEQWLNPEEPLPRGRCRQLSRAPI